MVGTWMTVVVKALCFPKVDHDGCQLAKPGNTLRSAGVDVRDTVDKRCSPSKALWEREPNALVSGTFAAVSVQTIFLGIEEDVASHLMSSSNNSHASRRSPMA